MTLRSILVVAALAATACGGDSNWAGHAADAVGPAPDRVAPASAMAYEPAQESTERAGAPLPAHSQAGAAPLVETSPSYLAYSYGLRFELPGARLAAVMDGHVAACRSAGDRVCQLMGADRTGQPDAGITASLSIRGEPTWLQQFMQTATADAEGAGGRLVQSNATTEDLTRSIVDSEAALRASQTLRERLLRLLESRPGTLTDLLAVERELARVQAEIDGTQSRLAVMRARVTMSALTIAYTSPSPPVSGAALQPLRVAWREFVRVVAESAATVVYAVAVLLPWAIVIALVIWLVRMLRRRARGRAAPRSETSGLPPPPPSAAS